MDNVVLLKKMYKTWDQTQKQHTIPHYHSNQTQKARQLVLNINAAFIIFISYKYIVQNIVFSILLPIYHYR